MKPEETERMNTRLKELTKEIPPEMWTMPVAMETNLVTWMGVHGCIQLALRHPAYTGASRRFVEEFSDATEAMLFEAGTLGESDREYIHREQAETEQQNNERRPVIVIPGVMRCRACGCMDDRACSPPCYWIEQDFETWLGLCSRCAEGGR